MTGYRYFTRFRWMYPLLMASLLFLKLPPIVAHHPHEVPVFHRSQMSTRPTVKVMSGILLRPLVLVTQSLHEHSGYDWHFDFYEGAKSELIIILVILARQMIFHVQKALEDLFVAGLLQPFQQKWVNKNLTSVIVIDRSISNLLFHICKD